MGNGIELRRRWGLARALAVTFAMGAGVLAVSSSRVSAAPACGVDEFISNVYVGPNDGSWTVTSNWSKGVLPSDGDICVPGGKVVIVPNGTTMVNPGSGTIGTLRIEGTVRINGTNAQVNTNWAYGGTNIINGGVIQVLNGSRLTMAPDQNGAPAFQNVIGGSLIQVGPGSSIVLQRPFSNNGTINLTGGGTLTLTGAASGYVSNATGSVIGGTVRMNAGAIQFGGGPLQVLATGGDVRGTITPSQSLDVACQTSSAVVSIPNSLVNNGTFRMRPPLAGNCSVDLAVPGGSTITNNGVFAVGDPAALVGWARYGTFVYSSGGSFVNGPTGTMNIHDYFTDQLSSTNNQGTLVIGPNGTLDHSRTPLNSSGTIVNNGACDVLDLTSSGLLDLVRSCNVRRTAVLTSSSVLRVYSSASALTSVSGMSQASTIAGSVDVVTNAGSPPALGTARTVFSAPASGQFANVTSASPTIAYAAIYPPNSGGLAQLQAIVPPAGGGGGSAINALVPGRLLDTRPGGSTVDGQAAGGGALGAGATFELQVAGRGGVPTDASAAVLNVTVADAGGPGYVTVFPCGAEQPNASNLNFAAGSTIPNGVIAKIGAGGKVCVFTSEPTQVLADVAGYFTPSSPYRPLVPGRLLDTRNGGATIDGQSAGGGSRPADSITEVQVAGRGGVPADASAAVLNVTAADARGTGYVTVFPCGAEQPNASSLNFVAGSTIPNNVITKLGDGGKVCLYTSAGTELLADVAGYFAPSPAFAPLVPGRLLDTRQGAATIDGAGQGGGVRPAGSVTEVQVAGRGGVPAGASAAVLNVTVSDALATGYVTVFPCGAEQPNASSLNFVAGSTIPNGVITKIGDGGKVCLYTSEPTQLLTDVGGYFAG